MLAIVVGLLYISSFYVFFVLETLIYLHTVFSDDVLYLVDFALHIFIVDFERRLVVFGIFIDKIEIVLGSHYHAIGTPARRLL